MFVSSKMIITAHFVVLLSFIAVTSLLMMLTILNRFRVRHVCMSWRSGRLFGLPVSPVVFGSLIVLLLTVAIARGQNLDMAVLAGYITGAAFWFAGSVLSNTVLVTEFGIILNVNYAEKTLVWGQVVDYFEFKRGFHEGFVFFFVDRQGVRRRVEVLVPARLKGRFKALVGQRLDARFNYTSEQVPGEQALEG